MTLIHKLDVIIERHDLNQTKFYQAWTRGELSEEALRSYANDYGNFIGKLGAGWEQLGHSDQAGVEDRHYDIWRNDFCSALKTQIAEIVISEVADLCNTADDMFSEQTSAIAALYVFIAQQASTSKAKIEGLREHYNYGSLSETYFEEHLDTSRLMKMLETEVASLSRSEHEKLLTYAEDFAQKLCRALDGIYTEYSTSVECA